MAIRTILVPTDFSTHSSAALDQAIELARALSARLVLLHSYWINLSMAAADFWTVPPDFMEQMRKAAILELEGLAKRALQAGATCETRVSADPTTSAILDLAEALPADLIVMGTHGHTGLRHVVLGSTAERVVRLAPCPVLTVKDHRAAEIEQSAPASSR